MADGTNIGLPALSVRATEYTVGAGGPAAMPAELPASSAYTYAVELSADEATAMGASTVRFSAPLPFYVDNFLGFPVGGAVPIGYYDRERARWIAEPDGRVIAILDVENGRALIDSDGDALADDALGISDLERTQLAQLYPQPTSLWRSTVSHWTIWDCNWPFGPPPDALSPSGLPPPDLPSEERDQCEEPGSVI
jgi:hypothetical protein